MSFEIKFVKENIFLSRELAGNSCPTYASLLEKNLSHSIMLYMLMRQSLFLTTTFLLVSSNEGAFGAENKCLTHAQIAEKQMIIATGNRENASGIGQEFLIAVDNKKNWSFYFGENPVGQNNCLEGKANGSEWQTNDYRQLRKPTIPLLSFPDESKTRQQCTALTFTGTCGSYKSYLKDFPREKDLRVAFTGFDHVTFDDGNKGKILATVMASDAGDKKWVILQTLSQGATYVMFSGQDFEWDGKIKSMYDRRLEK